MMDLIRLKISSVINGAIKRFSGYGRYNEVFTNREFLQHYGFTSRPLADAEGLCLKKDNQIYLIATDDRRYRVTLESGEVAIYTDEGDRVYLNGFKVYVYDAASTDAESASKPYKVIRPNDAPATGRWHLVSASHLDPTVFELDWYTNISTAAAVVNASSSDCTLKLTTPSTLTENLEFNGHVTVEPTAGNPITAGNYNLKINKLAPTGFIRWFIKSGTGDLTFGDGATEYVSPHWWDGTEPESDITDGLQGAYNSMPGAHIMVAPGVYEWSAEITNTATNNRGGYILEGAGCVLHPAVDTTLGRGTTLRWTGSATNTGFDLGQGPTYIGGVLQSTTNYHFGNQVRNISIVFETGIERCFYLHDQDNTTFQNVYFDAFNRNDVRGIIDARGTVNNVKLDQVIFANVPNGYTVRAGDGATNWEIDQIFVENCALGVWLGDVPAYQDPYQTGIITIRDSTFEGLSGDGKFVVTTLNGAESAAITEITVTDSTGMAEGDPIYLDHGDSKFEMNRISGISGNDLTLAYDTEYAHDSGVIVLVGEIGIYSGYSGSTSGRTTSLRIVRPMFDRIGCGIALHDTESVEIIQPNFVTSMVRGLYLDGNVQNITLNNPRVWAGMPSTWRLFEITSRGGTYNFNWIGGVDKSGVSEPYINNQGEIDGFYIGSFAQTSGASTFPAYFRGITFDGTEGIVINEADNAIGLKYKTAGNTNFYVTPAGLGMFASGLLLPGGNIWFANTAEPSAPATGGTLFVEQWGDPAKGHLYVKFPSGAKQLIATEP